MKVKLRYYDSFGRFRRICVANNKDIDGDRGEFIAIYISSLTLNDFKENGIYEKVLNYNINSDYIFTDAIDAIIKDNNVVIGFNLYLDGDTPDDYDQSETEYYSISRIELAYLMSCWFGFLNRPILYASYQEIIDSEDAYK